MLTPPRVPVPESMPEPVPEPVPESMPEPIPESMPEPAPEAVPEAKPVPKTQPEAAAPKQPAPIEPAPKEQAAPTPAEPAQVIKPKPAPPPPLFDPEQAVGWSAEGLIAEIGAADFIRAEGAMRVWQYRSSYCVADFFFYPKADQAELLVLRGWHIRPANVGAGLSEKTCFEELGRRL